MNVASIPGYLVITASPAAKPLKRKKWFFRDFPAIANRRMDKRVKNDRVVSIQTFCEQMMLTGSIHRAKAASNPVISSKKTLPRKNTTGINITPMNAGMMAADAIVSPKILNDKETNSGNSGGYLKRGCLKYSGSRPTSGCVADNSWPYSITLYCGGVFSRFRAS